MAVVKDAGLGDAAALLLSRTGERGISGARRRRSFCCFFGCISDILRCDQFSIFMAWSGMTNVGEVGGHLRDLFKGRAYFTLNAFQAIFSMRSFLCTYNSQERDILVENELVVQRQHRMITSSSFQIALQIHLFHTIV